MPEWIARLLWRTLERFLLIVLERLVEWLISKLEFVVRNVGAGFAAKARERRAEASEELRQAQERGDHVAAAKAEVDIASTEREEIMANQVVTSIVEELSKVNAEASAFVRKAIGEASAKMRDEKLLPPSGKDAKAIQGDDVSKT